MGAVIHAHAHLGHCMSRHTQPALPGGRPGPARRAGQAAWPFPANVVTTCFLCHNDDGRSI